MRILARTLALARLEKLRAREVQQRVDGSHRDARRPKRDLRRSAFSRQSHPNPHDVEAQSIRGGGDLGRVAQSAADHDRRAFSVAAKVGTHSSSRRVCPPLARRLARRFPERVAQVVRLVAELVHSSLDLERALVILSVLRVRQLRRRVAQFFPLVLQLVLEDPDVLVAHRADARASIVRLVALARARRGFVPLRRARAVQRGRVRVQRGGVRGRRRLDAASAIAPARRFVLVLATASSTGGVHHRRRGSFGGILGGGGGVGRRLCRRHRTRARASSRAQSRTERALI
eukprot:31400-Pelagococcus_subviridis.AAC.7